MYVHIGGECTLMDHSILGIFDFDALTESAEETTLNFLRNAEQEGRLETIPGSLPLAVVLAINRVYMSPLSPDVLRQRLRKTMKNR